jgi:urease accessory protein
MTRAHRHLLRIAALGTSFLPALALAHPGHGEDDSFIAGALHPMSGVDHVIGFLVVGLLVARLGSRYVGRMTAAFAGLLVAAWTNSSDGWQYAAGFMFTGSIMVAAAMAASKAVNLAGKRCSY